jgi:anti-sigma factor RsiW
MLPALVDGSDSLELRRHLAGCPECKAESARYEALLGSMSALKDITEEPPAALLQALQSIPTSGGRLTGVRTHVSRNRKAYAGTAAVLATGVAGALVWRTRSRRPAAA